MAYILLYADNGSFEITTTSARPSPRDTDGLGFNYTALFIAISTSSSLLLIVVVVIVAVIAIQRRKKNPTEVVRLGRTLEESVYETNQPSEHSVEYATPGSSVAQSSNSATTLTRNPSYHAQDVLSLPTLAPCLLSAAPPPQETEDSCSEYYYTTVV